MAYILCDIFRFWICLFIFKDFSSIKVKFKEKQYFVVHFWRTEVQNSKLAYTNNSVKKITFLKNIYFIAYSAFLAQMKV